MFPLEIMVLVSKFSGIYSIRPLGEKGFDWYVGAGLSTYLGNPFQLGITGEIGLEYHFDFPVAIGADWRPTFIVIDHTDFEGWLVWF